MASATEHADSEQARTVSLWPGPARFIITASRLAVCYVGLENKAEDSAQDSRHSVVLVCGTGLAVLGPLYKWL